jgi:phage shock protein PspC (stress-responsive transcriptional regulator)
VCGGIGDKYGIDANLVRLIWAAFAIGTMGLGALLYFLVGLVLPEGSALPATTGGRNGSGPEAPHEIKIVDATAERKG